MKITKNNYYLTIRQIFNNLFLVRHSAKGKDGCVLMPMKVPSPINISNLPFQE